MTEDEIIRMARKAGFLTHENSLYTNHRYGDCLQEVERFAALVAAAVCESLAAEAEKNGNSILAMQLRARGQA
jgi:hypothetical protein